MDTSLEALNGLLEVVAEAKLLLILLDPLEALELELSTLQVEFEFGNLLSKLPQLKIDFGCLAEIDWPLEEAAGERKVTWALHRLEAVFHAL